MPLDDPDAVKRAFAGRDVQFVEVENDPLRREGAGLLLMLEAIKSLAGAGEGRALFLAHAKGVTYHDRRGVVHEWADVMYETLLDYWPVVEESLSRHPIVGSFRRVGHTLNVDWHYSGSFCWIRSHDLFRRDWKKVDRDWWAMESYPGRHFHVSESGVVFHDATTAGRAGGDLYLEHVWRDEIRPAFEEWKRANEHLRTRDDAEA